MTASAQSAQLRARRRERRIIERPRLIKLLDETDARTILLLAPAGYGKTTLARQWAKTLTKSVWLSLTPAHQDVSVLALELATALDHVGGSSSSLLRSYVKASANPQRAAREIAYVLGDEVERTAIPWILLDDYHEVCASREATEFLQALRTRVTSRLVIASRIQPDWATPRLAIYGDVFVLSREELALDPSESVEVLGRRPGGADLIAQAEGWPAVIGLAAASDTTSRPPADALLASLHNYFADELYRSAPAQLQQQLIQLALAPDLSRETLAELFGADGAAVIRRATDLGFTTARADGVELHPLIRDFLLEKLSHERETAEVVDAAIHACTRRERWERAFQLILRFNRRHLVEPVLELAYNPLVRSGQLGTLSSFASKVMAAPAFPPPAVDLVEAEIAFRDGEFRLAEQIAERSRSHLPRGHTLRSRASAIRAQSLFSQGRLAEAEREFHAAFDEAVNTEDQVEALRGWALASVQGETRDSDWAVEQLAEHKNNSPIDLVRYATVELARCHFSIGFRSPPSEVDEAKRILTQVEDPRARTSFACLCAYVSAVGADYLGAARLMTSAEADIEAFGLDFARPYALWNDAFVALGLRRFGVAERALQKLEDSTSERPLGYHVLNARILRARLRLFTGRAEQALSGLPSTLVEREPAMPSIGGEFLAMRALCLATLQRFEEALETAAAAQRTTGAVEVRVLCAAVEAMAGDITSMPALALQLWTLAESLGAWDPLIAAARSSRQLETTLASLDDVRPALADLYARSNDMGLARRAGVRSRSSRSPSELLSPRELEVLGLLAQGLRNRDIAEALVISQSTTKVHVRHILEKLGVRTRAEAVARIGASS